MHQYKRPSVWHKVPGTSTRLLVWEAETDNSVPDTFASVNPQRWTLICFQFSFRFPPLTQLAAFTHPELEASLWRVTDVVTLRIGTLFSKLFSERAVDVGRIGRLFLRRVALVFSVRSFSTERGGQRPTWTCQRLCKTLLVKGDAARGQIRPQKDNRITHLEEQVVRVDS